MIDIDARVNIVRHAGHLYVTFERYIDSSIVAVFRDGPFWSVRAGTEGSLSLGAGRGA
jgi:hypothetical protein